MRPAPAESRIAASERRSSGRGEALRTIRRDRVSPGLRPCATDQAFVSRSLPAAMPTHSCANMPLPLRSRPRCPASKRMPSKKERPPLSACLLTCFQCSRLRPAYLDPPPPLGRGGEPVRRKSLRGPEARSRRAVRRSEQPRQRNRAARPLRDFPFALSPIFTFTTGRGGRAAFHQSGTRTTSPLSSRAGMLLRNGMHRQASRPVDDRSRPIQ